jgi:hypothetical protein
MRPGLYADVLASGRVAGYTVATYSARDLPKTVFYPLGAATAQDFLAMRTDPRRRSTLVAVLPRRPGDSALAGPPRPAPPPDVVEVPKYGRWARTASSGPPRPS